MRKYIVTAKSPKDIFALLVDTASVDVQNVDWNADSIVRSQDDADCDSEDEICRLLDEGKLHEIDDIIMGGDVPVGGMVVLCDDGVVPSWGFVCGNGVSWYKVRLRPEIANAIKED